MGGPKSAKRGSYPLTDLDLGGSKSAVAPALLYFFHPVCSCTSFRFAGTSGLSFYDKKQTKKQIKKPIKNINGCQSQTTVGLSSQQEYYFSFLQKMRCKMAVS